MLHCMCCSVDILNRCHAFDIYIKMCGIYGATAYQHSSEDAAMLLKQAAATRAAAVILEAGMG